MLLVPDGGAALKVKVVPDVEYVLGSCTTPEIATIHEVGPAGAIDIVNAVVEPFPLNVSVRNAAVIGLLPIYDIIHPLVMVGYPQLPTLNRLGSLCY
jgi:hypothetical protein